MKKFQWRLDRVLEIKQKEEQARRAQLVDITQRLTQARCELFMQKRILQNLVDDLTKITPRQRLSQQAFFMRYSEANHVKIKKIEEDVRTLAVQQEEKIAEVVKIKRFNEGLEKLRSISSKKLNTSSLYGMVILKPINSGLEFIKFVNSLISFKSNVEYVQSLIESSLNFFVKYPSENEYEMFLPISPNSRMFVII